MQKPSADLVGLAMVRGGDHLDIVFNINNLTVAVEGRDRAAPLPVRRAPFRDAPTEGQRLNLCVNSGNAGVTNRAFTECATLSAGGKGWPCPIAWRYPHGEGKSPPGGMRHSLHGTAVATHAAKTPEQPLSTGHKKRRSPAFCENPPGLLANRIVKVELLTVVISGSTQEGGNVQVFAVERAHREVYRFLGLRRWLLWLRYAGLSSAALGRLSG